jgi:phosphotransferase family enzyme
VERLPHGYTNCTRVLPNGGIEKRYDGPARWENARRETVCLDSLRGRLPVPRIIERDLSIPTITTEALAGRHGQDLIADGHAAQVLRLVGETLRQLQSISPEVAQGLAGEGPVIVHGDFGPQNMHFELSSNTVVGVLDWESAHRGDPVEDLAWAEWIVRAHHPNAVWALHELHRGAALDLPWVDRQTAIVRRIRQLLAYCNAGGMTQSAAEWRRRLAAVKEWTNL